MAQETPPAGEQECKDTFLSSSRERCEELKERFEKEKEMRESIKRMKESLHKKAFEKWGEGREGTNAVLGVDKMIEKEFFKTENGREVMNAPTQENIPGEGLSDEVRMHLIEEQSAKFSRLETAYNSTSGNRVPFRDFYQWYEAEKSVFVAGENAIHRGQDPKKETEKRRGEIEKYTEEMKELVKRTGGSLAGDNIAFENLQKNPPKNLDGYVAAKKNSILQNNLTSEDPSFQIIVQIYKGSRSVESLSQMPERQRAEVFEALYSFLEEEGNTSDFTKEWNGKIEGKKTPSYQELQNLWIGNGNGKKGMDLFTLAMLQIARDTKNKLEASQSLRGSIEKAKAAAGTGYRIVRIDTVMTNMEMVEGYKRVGILGDLWGFAGYEVGTLWAGATFLFNLLSSWQEGQGFGGFLSTAAQNPYLYGSAALTYGLTKVANRSGVGSQEVQFFSEQDISDWKYQFFGDPDEVDLIKHVNWKGNNIRKDLLDSIKKGKEERNKEKKQMAKSAGEKVVDSTLEKTNELSAQDLLDFKKENPTCFKDGAEEALEKLAMKEKTQAFPHYHSAEARLHFWKVIEGRKMDPKKDIIKMVEGLHDLAISRNVPSSPDTVPQRKK